MTEFGLKGTHVMCLFYLHHNEKGLTASQLCALCEEDKAAVSRTIAELNERGYILIELNDGKKYRAPIVLTEQGRQVALKVDQLVAQWVDAGGEQLSEEEREAFYHALSTISENLRKNYPARKKK